MVGGLVIRFHVGGLAPSWCWIRLNFWAPAAVAPALGLSGGSVRVVLCLCFTIWCPPITQSLGLAVTPQRRMWRRRTRCLPKNGTQTETQRIWRWQTKCSKRCLRHIRYWGIVSNVDNTTGEVTWIVPGILLSETDNIVERVEVLFNNQKWKLRLKRYTIFRSASYTALDGPRNEVCFFIPEKKNYPTNWWFLPLM